MSCKASTMVFPVTKIILWLHALLEEVLTPLAPWGQSGGQRPVT